MIPANVAEMTGVAKRLTELSRGDSEQSGGDAVGLTANRAEVQTQGDTAVAAVPVPGMAMKQVERLSSTTVQAQTEPESEWALAGAQEHAAETGAAQGLVKLDADVMTVPMYVDK